MSKAGINEKNFKKIFEEKFGKKILKGKKTFQDEEKKVYISVDEHCEVENTEILIEIDSGKIWQNY